MEQMQYKKGYAKYPNAIFVENGVGKLVVGKNKEIIIFDAEDYDRVKAYQWSIGGGVNHKYAQNEFVGYLHRYLLKYSGSLSVDHVNGNVYDNRKCNLRIARHKDNIYNACKHRKQCTSKYKGVCWARNKNKWLARIYKDGKNRFLGHFESEIDAAIAYNEAAKELFGEYARLNVIEKKECAA